nr:DNA circularization N-terminal domain-containing protein [uncultured Rhodopila sp.]
MDFITDIVAITGALADASWNGVPFYMPDSRHQVGRRLQRFLFPGQDVTAFQDLGAFDGPMRINGLLIGDRYIHYGQQIEQALRTAGPGTLVHPWLGALKMVLLEPATITYSQRELRMVRFEAVFVPFYPAAAPATSSLDALLDDITAAYAAGQAYLVQALAPVATAIALAGQVEGYFSTLQSYWQINTGAVPTYGAPGNPQLAAACAAPIAALATVETVAPGIAYGNGVYALLAAVPAAVVAASTPVQASAVGPGDAAVAATPIDGRITMAALVAASAAAAAQFSAASATTLTLALAQAAITACAAAQAATSIAWDSAQEAETALGTLVAALDAAAVQAAVASAPTVSTSLASVMAGQLWAALEDTRRSLITDLNQVIGRLPQVQTVGTVAQLSAWTLANMLAGDNPALIFPAYQDLISRNGVRNPAIVAPGTLELLLPAALPTLLPGASAA